MSLVTNTSESVSNRLCLSSDPAVRRSDLDFNMHPVDCGASSVAGDDVERHSPEGEADPEADHRPLDRAERRLDEEAVDEEAEGG